MNTFISSIALVGMLLNASTTIPVEQEEEPAPSMPAKDIKIAGDLIARYEKYKSLFSQEESIEKDEDNSSHIILETGEAEVTAYSSTPDQTDNDPFIMASGKHVYDGAIAANFLPFGTKVRFPEIYGDKIFTVEDRMHRRFSERMDIWMETRREAEVFGIKKIRYEVVEEKESNAEKIAMN
ncbi:MAG: 3D domain-containing protein [Parcubacteria group bacterium]|nr:3D domain-containing protein [Parcubacteria group bacterium]MCR4342911.1 3D domain-containing protein [Patescibacteria group bacterium]